MRKLVIDPDRLKQLLRYDPETGVFRWRQITSHRAHVGAIAGSGPRSDGYWRIRIDDQLFAAHRLAWLYVHGEMPPDDIDHIDGDRLNNRIANLRLASRSQNLGNGRKRRVGLKGAYWNKRQSRWASAICVHGKRFHLGCFGTEDEAHAAYVAAALQHFGEFARI